MRTFPRIGSLLFGILSFVGCGSTPILLKIPVRPGPSVEAPIYHRNDRWVFRATKENNSPLEFTVSPPVDQFDCEEANIAEVCHTQLFDESLWTTINYERPKIKSLDFPLVPGKTWSYAYGGNGYIYLRDAQVLVVGPTLQPVRTAAGEFSAIEIRRIETWRNGERTTAYFYSPETKSVVKLHADAFGLDGDRHYEMELLRYDLGK